MNRYLKKRSIALAISALTLVLIISVLIPPISANYDKIFFTADYDENHPVGYGYGYGYGYGVCPRTPGYWKNHPNAWPVDSVIIGGITYAKEEAIGIMNTPPGGDMTYVMFNHLVAAKLNVANGCVSSCIEDTIQDADDWMETYGPVGSGVSASSPAWQEGEPLKDTLDQYNNGLLCA